MRYAVLSPLLLLASMGGGYSEVLAASFNCKNAHSDTEKAICASAQLNQLDEDMAQLYRSRLADLPKKGADFIKQSQTVWLRQRDLECKINITECLTQLYQDRIDILRFRQAQDYATSLAGQLTGLYHKDGIEFFVEATSAESITISLQTAPQDSLRCRFYQRGEVKPDKSLQIEENDRAGKTVSFVFYKQGATVNESGEGGYYCGKGVSLSRDYVKLF